MSDSQSLVQGLVGWPSIRRFHRGTSIAFTATVIANFIVRAFQMPPAWITYSPLPPLALLLLTGLYLFVLPYTEKWRDRGRT